jgi:hypothetical protein
MPDLLTAHDDYRRLNEVLLREALRMVALESKTFWRPVSPMAIFVASEGKRKEFENNVMKTLQRLYASGQGSSNNCLAQALDR